MFLVDADLHGLVDGHIEIERRADALRRLAASPIDRARVEAWQSQNDLLRSAFAGVDREPLPVLLDLRAKPRLHCIPANDSPLVAAIGGATRPKVRRRRFGRAVIMILLIAAGLGGTWLVLESSDSDTTLATGKTRGTVEDTLAAQSSEAIDQKGPAAVAAQGDERLPTTEIPDLRRAGFSFTGADIAASDPASILFRYQNGADRLVISVARATAQAPSAAPIRIGKAYSWHKRDNAFAIAGTVRPGRLHAIALALQGGETQP